MRSALLIFLLSASSMLGVTNYVAQNGQTPVSPYTNGWESAASNIQDAVDVVIAGSTILVTNGIYVLTNTITVTNFTVKSCNLDFTNTVVNGNYPNVTNRCFILNHANAVVEGFMITNGYYVGPPPGSTATGGGGVSMSAGTLRNCLIAGNTETNASEGGGGGVYAIGGSISNCNITDNWAYDRGGGAFLWTSASKMGNCRIMYNNQSIGHGGGGVYLYNGSILYDSIIASNKCINSGSSACEIAIRSAGIIRNCLIITNNIGTLGRGVFFVGGGSISNATIDGNVHSSWNEGYFLIENTIISGILSKDTYIGTAYITLNNSRMNSIPTNEAGINWTNFVTSTNCITSSPQFVDLVGKDFRLANNSPCIDTGTNAAWMVGTYDFAGNARIFNFIVDMGCYEYYFISGQTSLLIPPINNMLKSQNVFWPL